MVIEPPNKETVHSGPSRFCFVHFRDSLILITVLNRITAIMNLKVSQWCRQGDSWSDRNGNWRGRNVKTLLLTNVDDIEPWIFSNNFIRKYVNNVSLVDSRPPLRSDRHSRQIKRFCLNYYALFLYCNISIKLFNTVYKYHTVKLYYSLVSFNFYRVQRVCPIWTDGVNRWCARYNRSYNNAVYGLSLISLCITTVCK